MHAVNEIRKTPINGFMGSRITWTSNEIKDIIKVIRSLENKGILLKETITNIRNQKGGFFNFLGPLMSGGLPLMKSMLTPLTKMS